MLIEVFESRAPHYCLELWARRQEIDMGTEKMAVGNGETRQMGPHIIRVLDVTECTAPWSKSEGRN